MPTLLQVVDKGQLRGAEVFAVDLAAELARGESWDVTLCCLTSPDQSFAALVAHAGVRIIVAQPERAQGRFNIRLLRNVLALVNSGAYEIVQANGGGTFKYLAAARRLSRGSWRLVFRDIGMGGYWRRGAAIKALAYRWILAQSDLVVAVGDTVATGLITADRIDPRRVLAIPNGVDPSRARNGNLSHPHHVRAALGVAADDSLIIYVGSLSPEKNLLAVVDLIAACRRKGMPVKGVFVGDGPCGPRLQRAVRDEHLEPAVRFLPAQKDIGRYLSAADLFVLPSTTEGMPAALIEAGLAGVPAVAASVGGVPEIIEDGITGALVRSGNRDDLIAAVMGLLRDGARRTAMAEAARIRYGRFEIARVARAYHDAYVSLLN